MRRLLDPDGGLMLTLGQVTDCVFLSLFFLVGCVPVVTAGASAAALYDAAYRALRRGDRHGWRRFWGSFRRNWRAGLVPTLVCLSCLAAAGRGLIWLWNAGATGALPWAAFCAGAAVGCLVLGAVSVVFAALSRFENSTAALLRSGVLLALANAPRTLALGALNAGCLWLCLRYIFPLFFLPALAGLLGSFLVEPMFRPYMPEEPEASLSEGGGTAKP